MASEDEYEYEYSATETETFYVDLDLSSVNGVLKSTNAGDRKTLKAPESAPKPAIAAVAEDEDNDENQDAPTPAQEDSPRQESPTPNEDKAAESGESVQILDFHTHNPIVSYQNQVYSCSWTDMIGTNMFFTKHQDAPLHDPELSTEDYDLIGTSRIKLVGRKARLVPTASAKKRRREDDESVTPFGFMDSDEEAHPGRSLGGIKNSNPKINSDIRKQANFLEKLMDVKKQRGEQDTVRTFVDRQSSQSLKPRRDEIASPATAKEIERLNRRVVKGDVEALERLQEIYSRMEEAEIADDEVPQAAAAAAATTPGPSSSSPA